MKGGCAGCPPVPGGPSSLSYLFVGPVTLLRRGGGVLVTAATGDRGQSGGCGDINYVQHTLIL